MCLDLGSSLEGANLLLAVRVPSQGRTNPGVQCAADNIMVSVGAQTIGPYVISVVRQATTERIVLRWYRDLCKGPLTPLVLSLGLHLLVGHQPPQLGEVVQGEAKEVEVNHR